MSSKIRIIAGTLRSRLISVPDNLVRPTSNRIRETLFNWLRDDIIGANCLDLFAGSGALGFEALSRGAFKVSFIEKDQKVFQNLKKNNDELKLTTGEFIHLDALSFLKKYSGKPFNIVFLDPPYAENLIAPCLELLTSQKMLTPDAQIYIEHNQILDDIVLPQELTLLKNKKAGKVYYGLIGASLRYDH